LWVEVGGVGRISGLAVVRVGEEKVGDGRDQREEKDRKYLRGRFGIPSFEAYCNELSVSVRDCVKGRDNMHILVLLRPKDWSPARVLLSGARC